MACLRELSRNGKSTNKGTSRPSRAHAHSRRHSSCSSVCSKPTGVRKSRCKPRRRLLDYPQDLSLRGGIDPLLEWTVKSGADMLMKRYFQRKGIGFLYNDFKTLERARSASDAADTVYDIYKKGQEAVAELATAGPAAALAAMKTRHKKPEDPTISGNKSWSQKHMEWTRAQKMAAAAAMAAEKPEDPTISGNNLWTQKTAASEFAKTMNPMYQNGKVIPTSLPPGYRIHEPMKVVNRMPINSVLPTLYQRSVKLMNWILGRGGGDGEDAQELEPNDIEAIKNEVHELQAETEALFHGMEEHDEAVKDFGETRTHIESMARSVARMQGQLERLAMTQRADPDAAPEGSSGKDPNVLRGRRVPACPYGLHASVADCFSDRCLVSCARCRERLIKSSREEAGGPQVCLRCRVDVAVAAKPAAGNKKRGYQAEEGADGEVKIAGGRPVKRVKSSDNDNKAKTKIQTKVQAKRSEGAGESDGSQRMTIWQFRTKKAVHQTKDHTSLFSDLWTKENAPADSKMGHVSNNGAKDIDSDDVVSLD